MYCDDPFAQQLLDEIAHLRERVIELEAATAHYRHEAEALAHSERHYRMLVQNVSDIIFTVDTRGIITSVSPAITPITGWRPEEWIGRPLLDAIHPDYHAVTRDKLARCLQRESLPITRVRIICRSGEYCMLEVRIVAQMKGDRAIGIVGVARDITQKEKAEATLREKSRQMGQLLTSARHLTASLDVKEVLIRIAVEARTILNAYEASIYLIEADGLTLTPMVAIDPPHEEILLATPLDVRHSLTGQAVITRRGVICNDTTTSDINYHVPGTPYVEDERVLAVPLIVDDEVLGALCLNRTGPIFRDEDLALAETFAIYAAIALQNARLYRALESEIETRCRTQEALQQSERLYRSLFEQASDAILLETVDRRIIDANQKACNLLGYTHEELLSLSVSDIVPPESQELVDEAMQTQPGEQPAPLIEGYNVHKDGTLIPVETSISWVDNDEQNLILAIVRDITERKLTEEALRRRTEQLEALRRIRLEMTNQLDPSALLRLIVSYAVKLLDKEIGGLYLYRPERDLLEWALYVGHMRAPIGTTLCRGEGLAGQVWEYGRPIAVNDYHRWEGRVSKMLRYSPPSVVGAPVRWGDEFLGVITVSDENPGAFSQYDAELLSLFAAQAAVAIKNARLFEETQQQSRRLSQALIVSEALHHALDIDEVLEQVTRGAASLGFARAAINIREPDGSTARVRATHGLSEEERQILTKAPLRWADFETLMQERFLVSRSYLIRQDEVDWDQLFDGATIPARTENRGPGYWAPYDALMVPLWGSQGQIIGLLSVDEPLDGLLPGLGVIQTLETFANQAALAIENARLYREARREIAERRRAEDALRESEEKYRTLVEGAAQPILTLSYDGVLLYVNSVAARILGIPPEEIIGRSISEVRPGSQTASAVKILQRIAASGESQTFEYEVTVDGQIMWFQAHGHPLRNNEGEIVAILVIAMDISEQRRLEERLRQAEKMEAIGRLAGGVAHEFNNLLIVINGYSEFLLDALPQDSSMRQEAREIQRAGEQAAALTRQLLAFSRRQMLRLRTLNLNDVVKGLTQILGHVVGEDVTLSLSLAPDLGSVRADPGQIEQVIITLATNARDAMLAGGVLSIRTENVTADTRSDRAGTGIEAGHYILLSVGDTGHGIPDEVREHLFEPFFTTKEVGQGTGLGLASVYGIVRQLGGTIQVESRLGEGSVFQIYLPRTDIVDDLDMSTRHKRANTQTILVVEDDGAVRRLTARMLDALGYQVLDAPGASAALDLLRDHEIDLVLTDIVMPETSGQVFVDRLRRLCPNVDVIYMSGYSEEALKHHGLLTPGIHLIQKPFNQGQLADIVSRVLGQNKDSPAAG